MTLGREGEIEITAASTARGRRVSRTSPEPAEILDSARNVMKPPSPATPAPAAPDGLWRKPERRRQLPASAEGRPVGQRVSRPERAWRIAPEPGGATRPM